jgi:hypothetical protein
MSKVGPQTPCRLKQLGINSFDPAVERICQTESQNETIIALARFAGTTAKLIFDEFLGPRVLKLAVHRADDAGESAELQSTRL